MRFSLSRNTLLWIGWTLGTVVVASLLLTRMLVAGDRSAMLPGGTTGVHHQFEVACETCHQAKPFSTEKKVVKELNKACRACHDDELKASDDSHPRKKFRPPRMARFWEKIDARNCTSCHLEHKPEITRAGAVTLAMDYCVACHSEGEQDVRKNRESHADLTFDTCANAGCHNFHDNRALYEDFLVKHAKAPWLSPSPIHEASLPGRERLRGAVERFLAKAAAPAAHADPKAAEHWAASAHAAADIGCAGCHAPKAKTEAEIEAQWVAAPEYAVCGTCHRTQQKTFAQGRHGMRGHPKIAKGRSVKKQLKAIGVKKPDADLLATIEAYLGGDATPPAAMTVAEARIPMKSSAHDRAVNCGTCHKPHAQDLKTAAVEACASCHDDGHTKAYFDSPHYALWRAEWSGEGAKGSGVSCATCHLAKTEAGDKLVTDHNQNANLRPNEKMIRPVCMSCHGLGFAIDALADPKLVANNFKGRPEKHIESIDWALRRVETNAAGANR